MICNTFTGRVASEYVAFDTETRTYIDGRILPEKTIRAMCKDTARYPVSWWREHAEVRAWAYIIYAPEGFAIAENWEEFAEIITRHRIACGWWYNAPFDFSVLDYDMLSRGWEHAEKARKPRQYSELSNTFGARYSMTINFPFTPEPGERTSRKHWLCKMYDLRNILHGGLGKLLKQFDVRGADGNPIRKLTMDYQEGGTSADDLAYMKADAEGLWWLVDTASRRFETLYGYSLRRGKPDVLTASGLAKRVVFDQLYPFRTYDAQKYDFRRHHPMTLEQDTAWRRLGLLGGGLVILNPDVKGKTLYNWNGYRYDFNSEYPFYMANMRSVCGRFKSYDGTGCLSRAHAENPPEYCYIVIIDGIMGKVKPYMVPSWRDPFSHDMVSRWDVLPGHTPMAIFEEELEELLCYWYDIEYLNISRVVVYPTRKETAIERVMRQEYQRKTDARVSGDDALSAISKLIMNGYGGKYSQNPNTDTITRAMDGDRVALVHTGTDTDEKSVMHVVQGARITCGGRVMLRKAIRQICGDTGVREHLAYTDTDSIHADVLFAGTSPTELGALKLENKTPIIEACFLAPKTYYEIEEEHNARDGFKGYTIHAKGVHTEDITDLLRHGEKLRNIYREGYRVQSLSALNVKGGKALLPLPKQLARVTAKNNTDEKFE